jgi:phosphonopyruvate decarboxylase
MCYFWIGRDFYQAEDVFWHFKKSQHGFLYGVPDSLRKDFCGYVLDHSPKENHIILANEGSAVGLAAGYK